MYFIDASFRFFYFKIKLFETRSDYFEYCITGKSVNLRVDSYMIVFKDSHNFDQVSRRTH